MKTKKWFVLGALGASILVSCNKEEISSNPDKNDSRSEHVDNMEESEYLNEDLGPLLSIDDLSSAGLKVTTDPEVLRENELRYFNSNDRSGEIVSYDLHVVFYEHLEDLLAGGVSLPLVKEGKAMWFRSPALLPDTPFEVGDQVDLYEDLHTGYNATSPDGTYEYQAIEYGLWYDLEDDLQRAVYTYEPNLLIDYTDITFNDLNMIGNHNVGILLDPADAGIDLNWSVFGNHISNGFLAPFGGMAPPPPLAPAADGFSWVEDYVHVNMKNKSEGIRLRMERGTAVYLKNDETGDVISFEYPVYNDQGQLNTRLKYFRVGLVSDTWSKTADKVGWVKL